MITVDSLIEAGVGRVEADLYAGPLLDACSRFEITTPSRAAIFVGQCMVESQLFKRTEENCNWSDPERIMRFFRNEVHTLEEAQSLVHNPEGLANVVYANRNGNGDVSSGDGWNYRGRGLIQATGRDKYANAGADLARPYIDQPDIVASPVDAALISGWFWSISELNALADTWNVAAITRRVNGPAMDQAALRAQYSEAALRAFT